MKLNGVLKRKTERREVLINFVIRTQSITGVFPSAYELATTMEVDMELATRCIDEARKRLYRGNQ